MKIKSGLMALVVLIAGCQTKPAKPPGPPLPPTLRTTHAPLKAAPPLPGVTSTNQNPEVNGVAIMSTPIPQTVTLAWDKSTDPTVVGYKLYQSLTSSNYVGSVFNDAGTNTSLTVQVLAGGTNYFVATSYTATGLESKFSAQVSYIAPAPSTITNVIIVDTYTETNLTQNFSTWAPVGPPVRTIITNPPGLLFFRGRLSITQTNAVP